jgi:hypothetical protein
MQDNKPDFMPRNNMPCEDKDRYDTIAMAEFLKQY